MIRVPRPAAPPVLTAAATAAATAELVAEAERAAAEGRPPQFRFKPSVYGHPTVRASLAAAFQDKCGFCETRPLPGSVSQVEHFRPKADRDHGTGSVGTGYYWLAYEWSNLLLACSRCNGKKGIWFPLADPIAAASDHRGEIRREEPLLLNPTSDDPTDHLRFVSSPVVGDPDASAVADVVVPVRGSRRGRTTIERVGLNRPDLVLARREHVTDMLRLKTTVAALTAVPDPTPDIVRLAVESHAVLEENRSTGGRYSAAVNATLAAVETI